MNGNHAVGFELSLSYYLSFYVKKAEKMVARMHSLKLNVERGWEEIDLGLLQDHAVFWLVFD